MKYISEIIARSLLKVASDEELDELSRWEKFSDKNDSFFTGLKTYWERPLKNQSDKRVFTAKERLLLRINSESDSGSGRMRIPVNYWLRIAAAVVLLIAVTGMSVYFGVKQLGSDSKTWVEVSTDAGQQSKVTLPDGSIVYLNAETVVKYHSEKGSRMVKLSGEAYFEVTHDPSLPFIVEAGSARVKVLGTKFNVCHYANSVTTEASLLSGKIALSLPEAADEIEVEPGQKVTYDEQKKTFVKTSAKVQNEILWKQGVLVFDNELFENMICKLERYYAVKFIYDNKVFGDMHYTGTIDNQSISRVLDFIKLTIPLKYEIDNKTIRLEAMKK